MTPRQWLAVICMASVAGSFSLRLLCESSCASAQSTAEVAGCHKSADTGTAVAAAAGCGQDHALVALTELRRAPAAVDLVASPSAFAVIEQPVIDRVGIIPAFADTGPPNPARILPLRI